MPRAQSSQTSPGRRKLSVSEQLASSNSTANAFLGTTRRPSWLVAGVTPAPTPRSQVVAHDAAAASVNSATATAADAASTVAPTSAPPKPTDTMPSAASALSTALSQNLLPSPAPSDEPSPIVSTVLDNSPQVTPTISNAAPPGPILTATAAVAVTSATTNASQGSTVTPANVASPQVNVAVSPPAMLPARTLEDARAASLHAIPSPGPGPAPVPTMAPSPASPMPQVQRPTCSPQSATTSRPSPRFPRQELPSQLPEQVQQPAVSRGNSGQSGQAMPTAAFTIQSTVHAPWPQTPISYTMFNQSLNTIANGIGGIASLSRELELPRVRLLMRACQTEDGFFLALHQLLCMWSVRHDDVCGILGDFSTEQVDECFEILDVIFRPNSEVRPALLRAFSVFPDNFRALMAGPCTYPQIFPKVVRFLSCLRMYWSGMCLQVVQRRYPLLVDELVGQLGCLSPIMQCVLFTTSRRRIGIPDSSYGAAMEQLFNEDQRYHQGGSATPYSTIAELEQQNSELIAIYHNVLQSFMSRGQSQASPTFPMQQTPQISRTPQTPQTPQTSFGPGGMARTYNQQQVLNQMQQAQPSSMTPQYPIASQAQQQQQTPQTQAHQMQAQGLQAQLLRAQFQAQQVQQAEQTQQAQPAYQVHFQHRQQMRLQSTQPNTAMHRQVHPTLPLMIPSQVTVSSQRRTPVSTPMESPRTWPRMSVQRAQAPVGTFQPAQATIQPRPQLVHINTQQILSARSQPSPQASTLFAPPGHSISRAEYPHDPLDKRALAIGLTEAHLKSPPRVLVDLDTGERLAGGVNQERFYQSVQHMAVGPVRTPVSHRIHRFAFQVTAEEYKLIAPKIVPDGELLPVVQHFDGSLRYRLRCCKVPHGDKELTEAEWTTQDTVWPLNIFINFNNYVVSVRRQVHNGKDLAAELTSMVCVGVNNLQVIIPEPSRRAVVPRAHILGVEMIKTESHTALLQRIYRDGMQPASTTLDEIKRRLTKPSGGGEDDNDDGLAVVQNDLSVDLADPFSTKIFDTPARGANCQHIECFDLANWLNTRPSNPAPTCQHRGRCNCSSRQPGQLHAEPTLPDKWRCPICSCDARPKSLRIDGFLVDVHAQLEKDGKLGQTKSILVAPNGTWTPVLREEDNIDDNDDDDELPTKRLRQRSTSVQVTARKVARTNSMSTATSHRKSNQPIEVIELD